MIPSLVLAIRKCNKDISPNASICICSFSAPSAGIDSKGMDAFKNSFAVCPLLQTHLLVIECQDRGYMHLKLKRGHFSHFSPINITRWCPRKISLDIFVCIICTASCVSFPIPDSIKPIFLHYFFRSVPFPF